MEIGMVLEQKRGRRRAAGAAPAPARDGARSGPDFSGEKPDTLLHYYRQMVLIRRFEERTGEMYLRANIGGYCHLNLGEEATIVGLMASLGRRDYVFPSYRGHGYALVRGVEPGRVMAELFGKETGV